MLTPEDEARVVWALDSTKPGRAADFDAVVARLDPVAMKAFALRVLEREREGVKTRLVERHQLLRQLKELKARFKDMKQEIQQEVKQ